MREQLRARLAEVWPELQIVAEARNGQEALQLTEQHRPELVFLDIRMPGMTGVEAARAIAQLPTFDDAPDGWPGCEVVFITAYDQYAVEAFEQGAVDYVLKPAERERLLVTVARIKKRLAQRRADSAGDGASANDGAAGVAGSGAVGEASGEAAGGSVAHMQQLLQQLNRHMNPAAAPPLRWIQATIGQSIQMIPVEDVLFFISDEKYTRVQTATLEALIRKPIKELLDELDADLFWQIHRSTLVNTRAIAGVSRDMRGRQMVSVKGHPEKLEVSRSFAGLFKGM
ncbi:MAG: transcriptional regulator [Methylibium sp. NZG]|nr:MAG: transcriptional regulator [Methylibium sp. NZG]